MRIVRSLESFPPDGPATTVALGVFDGVHLGHQAILRAALRRARETGLEALVCTFEPHPLEILQPGRAPLPIVPLSERLALIAALGLDAAVVLDFTPEMAAMEPEAFVKDVLLDRLRARQVVVGFNHTFGRGARGDAGLLQALAARLGFQAEVVPPLVVDGVQVSSSEIRAALEQGAVDRAQRYLGRPYGMSGDVVRGAGRGRSLGFPTANVAPDRGLPIPGGVYACHARVDGATYGAVVNVGTRPTFRETARVVEAHLINFSGVLYGQALRLDFIARLRDEQKFPGVDALREQIARDIAAARQLL
ncbi:MAG: bifunctional riboflavin kinase/FAD synthetase [Candidatus Rokubacteria bacterium]|nr:bifunctional riboflavin kinase/FAD synthetase [Candidatus Rokubacteria bacterium]